MSYEDDEGMGAYSVEDFERKDYGEKTMEEITQYELCPFCNIGYLANASFAYSGKFKNIKQCTVCKRHFGERIPQ